jgi:hypothetical protein
LDPELCFGWRTFRKERKSCLKIEIEYYTVRTLHVFLVMLNYSNSIISTAKTTDSPNPKAFGSLALARVHAFALTA